MDTIAKTVAKEPHVAMETITKNAAQESFAVDPVVMNVLKEQVAMETVTKTAQESVAKKPVANITIPKQQVTKTTVAKSVHPEQRIPQKRV
jgi:hypothetical protein